MVSFSFLVTNFHGQLDKLCIYTKGISLSGFPRARPRRPVVPTRACWQLCAPPHCQPCPVCLWQAPQWGRALHGPSLQKARVVCDEKQVRCHIVCLLPTCYYTLVSLVTGWVLRSSAVSQTRSLRTSGLSDLKHKSNGLKLTTICYCFVPFPRTINLLCIEQTTNQKRKTS